MDPDNDKPSSIPLKPVNGEFSSLSIDPDNDKPSSIPLKPVNGELSSLSMDPDNAPSLSCGLAIHSFTIY